jgi:hypothetical protein
MSLRFKLSPELADGDHWIIQDTPEQVLEAVKLWCEESDCVGAHIEVERVEMSQEEVDALPDI